MWLSGIFGFLLDPITVVSGAAVGAAARRWRHLIPGSLLPPMAFWAFYRASFGDDDTVKVLPIVLLVGAIWSVAAHLFRRRLTG